MADRWWNNFNIQERHLKEAKNYLAITCLLTYYNLLTLILTDNIYEQETTNDILRIEQKGIRPKLRECIGHLLLNNLMMEDSKKKKRQLCVMWIDYKKAYDSKPHSCLIEMMKLHKIDKWEINFIIVVFQNRETWIRSAPTPRVKKKFISFVFISEYYADLTLFALHPPPCNPAIVLLLPSRLHSSPYHRPTPSFPSYHPLQKIISLLRIYHRSCYLL